MIPFNGRANSKDINMLKPFLIIDAESGTYYSDRSAYASAVEIDGENLGIVMAENARQAIEKFCASRLNWKFDQVEVKHLPVIY